ncbi:MAG TPA: hypothetical protein VFA74_02200 [Terriglobales bacterium]|nr:hypothetical protein [Terriglobales bacterium]
MITSKLFKASLIVLAMSAATSFSFAQNNQAPSDLSNARPRFITVAPRGHSNLKNGAGIPGIDSLINFNGHYTTPGVGPTGKKTNFWYYNMVGKPPQAGGTTYINAPMVPVSLDLLNFDGNGNTLRYRVNPYIVPTLYSPVFQNSTYTSSDVPTQISDAVQRAEFYNVMKPNWHTLLNPNLKTERVMSVPAGSYFYRLKSDGTCCEFVLIDIDVFSNLLFPSTPTDTTTPVGAAENAGDITTKDISTFLFPNTYLYFNGDPNQCCVLGFHSYDFEPGDANNGNREKRYVLNYSSWISPGLFGGGFEDVTALSHEVSETYNDPFVASDNLHNVTPWWLSPNGNCQDDLEVGDVIEGLPQSVFPVAMNGRTYHPQNEALLQWFEFQSPSTALGGAYSYPNQNTLTALSPVEGVNCQ